MTTIEINEEDMHLSHFRAKAMVITTPSMGGMEEEDSDELADMLPYSPSIPEESDQSFSVDKEPPSTLTGIHCCRRLHDGATWVLEYPLTSYVMLLLTLWILVADDLRIIYAPPGADLAFSAVFLLSFILFALELVLSLIAQPRSFPRTASHSVVTAKWQQSTQT
jgi:hypothetical protein